MQGQTPLQFSNIVRLPPTEQQSQFPGNRRAPGIILRFATPVEHVTNSQQVHSFPLNH